MKTSNRLQVRLACGRVLKPLVKLMLRQGVAARELAEICKAIFVEVASKQHRKASGRVNQSRVAIVTGLTRAEVKRWLTVPIGSAVRQEWHKHRANRVLLAWHRDPQFLDARRLPRVLPIKGGKESFATLVRRYSGDIPARAMLDELLASGAVAKNNKGHVRVRLKTVPRTGSDAKVVATIGNKASDYLNTLVRNAGDNESPLFEATAYSAAVDPADAAGTKQRIAERGRNLVTFAENALQLASLRGSKNTSQRKKATRLGITVFVFERS